MTMSSVQIRPAHSRGTSVCDEARGLDGLAIEISLPVNRLLQYLLWRMLPTTPFLANLNVQQPKGAFKSKR
jgi:hypothetical protein